MDTGFLLLERETVMQIANRKVKTRTPIFVTVFGVVWMALFVFVQFTSVGYRMTIPFRNFTEIQRKVYIDNTYSGNKEEVISVLHTAQDRVSRFWGDVESSPTVIISDNKKTLTKLGGEKDTLTVVFFRAYSYISISSQYLDVDILAHELTHAELHARLYKGKLPQTLIPTWFDEGVATQNDYRKQYSEETWEEKTNHGSRVIALDDMDTASEFYAEDVENRRFRYMISRHEVKSWIEANGVDKLIELIEGVNAGENFYKLYEKWDFGRQQS